MPAAVPLLLVSTAARWYGAERMPRALAKAGFEVTLLTPRRSLGESSRFVRRVAYLADHTTPLDWIHAVAATVRAVTPAQIVPCDDVSFRLLAMLVVALPSPVSGLALFVGSVDPADAGLMRLLLVADLGTVLLAWGFWRAILARRRLHSGGASSI